MTPTPTGRACPVSVTTSPMAASGASGVRMLTAPTTFGDAIARPLQTGPVRNRRCPCGSGLPLGDCCGRLHDGTVTAATAEQLMRSRYSAFALGEPGYLLATWHPS